MSSEHALSYTALFDPAPEGGFVVTVPVLPGCMSQGETLEDAKRNIQDAIRAYVSVLKEDGDEIPRESHDQIIETVSALEPA